MAVISGFTTAIGTISISPVRASFFSRPAMKIRTPSWTCGAASPMP